MVKKKKQKKVSMMLIAIMIILIIAIVLIAGIENKSSCGNGKCDNEETCISCSQDCGSCPTTTTTKTTTTTAPIITTLQPTITTTVLPNVTTTTMPDSCTDTDDGVKYDVKGTVSGYHLGKPFSQTDFCTGDTLTEYYCLTYYGHINYNCAYAGKKCLDGTCV